MNKWEFLGRLSELLSDLAAGEREEALQYYENYFADAGAEKEAEVLSDLGSPEQVAEQIKAGLGKTEAGMFTENGYREKLEPGNPPQVYRDRSWQNAGAGQQEKTQNAGYQNNNWNTQKGNGKKKDMSAGTIALIIVLTVLASPVIISAGAVVFSVIAGILCTVFAIVLGLIVTAVVLFIVGIALLLGGFAKLFTGPFTGMLMLSGGCFLIGIELLMIILLILIFGKFLPWLVRGMENIGRYMRKKLFPGKKKGVAI